jgi:predicted GTPase
MTESPPTGQVMTRGAPTRVVILGAAAGRDFHDFNIAYREDPGVEVVAFTEELLVDL